MKEEESVMQNEDDRMSNYYRIDIEELPYMQICRLLSALEEEFLFVLLGTRPNSRMILVKEILVPYQEVSMAHCKIKEEGILEMHKAMKKIVGWGHSHDNFLAFHSGTDTDTGGIGAILYPPFASITVVKTGPWDCKVFNKTQKEGYEADLYLPLDVPLHKITVKKWFFKKFKKGKDPDDKKGDGYKPLPKYFPPYNQLYPRHPLYGGIPDDYDF